jgi:cytochrome b561
MLGNSENRYGLVSRGLHSLMMIMVIGMIVIGMYMTEIDKTDDLRKTLFAMHISTGVLVLVLAVVRVVWLKFSPAPKLPLGLTNWEKMLTTVVKSLMYLLMLAIPIAGYLMVNTKGFDVGFYGLFNLPSLLSENHDLHELFEEMHEFFAYFLVFLVLLHVAGSLKHRFLDTGPDLDVMKRMFGRD